MDIVLVVDDSPDTVRLLTDVLDGEGKTVTIALDGTTALRIAQKLHPDIVLMDAVMPEMDGFECCRRLKALPGFETVPVIFMTGLSEPGDVVRGFAAGGADYVTKPIDIGAMLARIAAHLANSRKLKSAQMALDATDQFLVAVNEDGEVLWFTPHALRLLQERLAFEAGRLKLSSGVIAWLSTIQTKTTSAQAGDAKPHFASSELSLHLTFLERTERGELLLRLSDTSPVDRIAAVVGHFRLTKRETEVLSWLARGKSTRDIAAILSLSPRTVDKHLQTIYDKMQVENRTSATAMILSFPQ